jgi:hypothetical protein
MTTGDENPLLIVPPPGLMPPAAPAAPAEIEEPAAPDERDNAAEVADPEHFITLPPGIADSATLRLASPRPPRATPAAAEEDDAHEIVFFPSAPGLAAVSPITSHADDPDATIARPPAVRDASPAWRLVLPDGEVVPVTAALFIGRNPARTAGLPEADLLAAIDPAKSLSKTHALVEIDDGELWIHDLDSTNGVFIAPAEGDVIEVEPGQRCDVPPGAEIELGEYVIRVELA